MANLPRAPLETPIIQNGRMSPPWLIYFHKLSELVTDGSGYEIVLNDPGGDGGDSDQFMNLFGVDQGDLQALKDDICRTNALLQSVACCDSLAERIEALEQRVSIPQEIEKEDDSGLGALLFQALQDDGLEGRVEALEATTLVGTKKVAIYTDTTDASGLWSVDYTAEGFTSVDMVAAILLRNAGGTLANESWATLYAFSTTAANGAGVESSGVLSAQGVEYVGAGHTVYVFIIGD